ncbi:hypothetical protein FRC20_012045 [Serendipita sp. 405]|nr:hypothetical protein FRC20_012045 [Serendipita sp. 405]
MKEGMHNARREGWRMSEVGIVIERKRIGLAARALSCYPHLSLSLILPRPLPGTSTGECRRNTRERGTQGLDGEMERRRKMMMWCYWALRVAELGVGRLLWDSSSHGKNIN